MLFSPNGTDGFHLVHTAKEYLEIVPNPNRIKLEHMIPLWEGQTMDIDVSLLANGANAAIGKNHNV